MIKLSAIERRVLVELCNPGEEVVTGGGHDRCS